MPAVTLQNSTVQSSQNCGVRMALLAETLVVVTSFWLLRVEGSKPYGFQPAAGTRTVTTPYIITTK